MYFALSINVQLPDGAASRLFLPFDFHHVRDMNWGKYLLDVIAEASSAMGSVAGCMLRFDTAKFPNQTTLRTRAFASDELSFDRKEADPR